MAHLNWQTGRVEAHNGTLPTFGTGAMSTACCREGSWRCRGGLDWENIFAERQIHVIVCRLAPQHSRAVNLEGRVGVVRCQ